MLHTHTSCMATPCHAGSGTSATHTHQLNTLHHTKHYTQLHTPLYPIQSYYITSLTYLTLDRAKTQGNTINIRVH